jgi:N utilization substance protein A
LLRRLLELEVPEIFHGSVEIKAIAREAGSRSKVAVYATQEGVDPVGSCVGVRGGRIQNVVNELGGEKIDVVQWDPDIAAFISNSLSPAKVMNVRLEDTSESSKTATVIVPDRQLSLAIGKEGQNARLAAKLTGWRIDIKSASEAAEETLGRLEDIEIAPEDMDLLTLAESILRTQDSTGFTAEQQRIVEQVVQEREGLSPAPVPDVAPEGEQAPEVPARQETETLLAAEAEAEPAAEAEARVEAPAPAVESGEAGAEVQVSAEGEAVTRYRPEDVLLEEIEPAQLPALEGEPVGDSIGWVQGQAVEEYFDWAAQEQPEDLAWLRDEAEVEDVEEIHTSKKKRGKRRGRQNRVEDDLEAIMRRPGKRGRTR